MEIKILELRDKATFIPIFAFRPQSTRAEENYLIRRAGFGEETKCVIMGRLDCSGLYRNCTYDPYSWGDRTFLTAHLWIEDHFDNLTHGEVIDVEFIVGETLTRKISESQA